MKSLQEHLNESLNESWYDIKVSAAVKQAKGDGVDFNDPDDIEEWLDMLAYDKNLEDGTPIDWLEDFHKAAKIRVPFKKWSRGMSGIER